MLVCMAYYVMLIASSLHCFMLFEADSIIQHCFLISVCISFSLLRPTFENRFESKCFHITLNRSNYSSVQLDKIQSVKISAMPRSRHWFDRMLNVRRMQAYVFKQKHT